MCPMRARILVAGYGEVHFDRWLWAQVIGIQQVDECVLIRRLTGQLPPALAGVGIHDIFRWLVIYD
jgi:hypothetical protein